MMIWITGILFVLLCGGTGAKVIHINMYPEAALREAVECETNLPPYRHIAGNIDDLSIEQISCSATRIMYELRGLELVMCLAGYVFAWLYIVVEARKRNEGSISA